jgi:hypothetical protein
LIDFIDLTPLQEKNPQWVKSVELADQIDGIPSPIESFRRENRSRLATPNARAGFT